MTRLGPLLLLLLARVDGASESLPHYHTGVLKQYKLAPPETLISPEDERLLRTGRPVKQAVANEDDTRRMIMIQDIQAPSQIVLSRIMDLQKYPEMVADVDSCVVYARHAEDSIQTVKSTYEISAMRLKYKYFVKHTFDPEQRCMTFCLDYDRRSDLDDTVGYWYVQPRARNSCRVFYSCECKLRGWVPGPVLDMLQKHALKKATTWVSQESLKEWHATRACARNDGVIRFVDNVRDSARRIRRLVHNPEWRRQTATHFVSNVRSSPAYCSPVSCSTT